MRYCAEYGLRVMDFWRKGMDTLQIARALGIGEDVVYNVLARLKDARPRPLQSEPPLVFRGVHVDRETA